MTLFLAWIVYPLVLVALSLGCGLLLQRAVGHPLPGVLLVPAGFAVIVVAASFTTMGNATASFTTPLVVALAIAGFALSFDYRARIDPWAAGAGVAVFAVYAAPIVLSGGVTFAGYLTLDDTATWLALADNAVEHGRTAAGLATSSYRVVLHDYESTGYPFGSFLPLGIGHQLTRQDAAWLFQPQIALMAAMLGLSIYSLSASLLRARPLRVAVAFLGAQSTLLFGYAFWSGIKEVTTAALAAVLAAVIAKVRAERWSARDMLPIAVVAAAILDVLAIVGTIWLAGLAVLAGALLVACGPRRGSILVATLGAATLVLAIPALAIAQVFFRVADSGSSSGSGITSGNELANLLHPLSNLQLFGIWPVGDFRLRPSDMQITYILIGALVVAGLAGLVAALRQRAWGVPLYLGAALTGCFSVIALKNLGHGSPWLDGKALATASPALVVAGIAGAAAMFEGGRRVEGCVAGAAIAAGVLWSNALAYGNVWLAPRGQFVELQAIGDHFAGDGPTLMTEFQPYGVRHFLRKLDPEGASERRSRPVYLRSGGYLAKLQYADLDAFQLSSILDYRTLVLRTSPLESRPPSVYRLVRGGRWYEVWQRPVQPRTILEHLSLGDEQQPVAVPSCADVRRLGALAAGRNGTLVAAERAPAQTVDLTHSTYPPAWQAGAGGTLLPHGAGTASMTIAVPGGGRYGFWVGGSFRDHLTLTVDGRSLGSATGQLNEPAQLTPLGATRLTAGEHRVELHYSGPGLRPGSRSYQFAFGPLEVGLPASDAHLADVPPSDASSLCGRSLDWIEAVAP
jgi:hypothetical protein